MVSLAIVGAGPRGVGILERLGAGADELLGDDRLVVHLIDPYPPGAGRVWRHDQSPLMLLNSMARDVTVWTDDSVRMDGRAAPGPTLAEWAAMAGREGVRHVDGTVDEDLTAEARALDPTTFASRRLQRAYLSWFFDEVVRRAPERMEVIVHTDRVVAVLDDTAMLHDGAVGDPGGDDATAVARDVGQVVELASGARLRVDAVVLAVGHLDREPTGPEAALASFAAHHRLTYLPPSYTADEDLSCLGAGRDVVVRGMGLAFVDLTVLVTEGRGGRYVTEADGRLTYLPSGDEPRLWAGSRRGVPYHAKLTYDLLGGRPALPRYFSADTVAELASRHHRLEFWPHVWPLIARELTSAYYRELALGHPDRVRSGHEELDARLDAVPWGSPEMRALIAGAVPFDEDRLDLEKIDRPLAGRTFTSGAEAEAAVADHIEADLVRRGDPYHSADLGMFAATLTVTGLMPRVAATGKLSARSRAEDVDGWWWSFFSSYSSGPPPERLRQLLALHRAGIVRFVGPGMWVRPDADRGCWTAGSAVSPMVVAATALVDARLPRPTVSASREPLIRALHGRGEAGEEVLTDGRGGDGAAAYRWRSGYLTVESRTMRLLDADGRAHPRRFALGANTSTGRGGAFARPNTNGLAFRHNDAAARGILGLLAGVRTAALAD